MGLVGQFRSVDAMRYPRRSRVIVRTPRGIEIGHVLATPDGTGSTADAEGQILRGMTIEDELLAARLEERRQDAFTACAEALAERRIAATLIDVEHLFDGQGLFFYFLGETPPELDAFTAELADAYDAKAEVRRFSETLTLGCGPDCGTAAAEGTGCVSCTGCAVATACKKPADG